MIEILVDQSAPIALEALDLLTQVVQVDRFSGTGLSPGEVNHLHAAVGTDRGSGRKIIEKASLNRLATVLTGEANLNLYGKQSVLG